MKNKKAELTHTPTPWELTEITDNLNGRKGQRGFSFTGTQTREIGGIEFKKLIGYFIGTQDKENRANAQFIVIACNEHEGLKAELKEVKKNYKNTEEARELWMKQNEELKAQNKHLVEKADSALELIYRVAQNIQHKDLDNDIDLTNAIQHLQAIKGSEL